MQKKKKKVFQYLGNSDDSKTPKRKDFPVSPLPLIKIQFYYYHYLFFLILKRTNFDGLIAQRGICAMGFASS